MPDVAALILSQEACDKAMSGLALIAPITISGKQDRNRRHQTQTGRIRYKALAPLRKSHKHIFM